ncbi:acyltransferase ChoActase/COT/CPT [Sporormia fimetaria CBS 119925]|uniref:Carnitine O-acetyltransferase, mitochondrial n=1 Tax=Sporormia fimetaria CBS 119925 TaxID=1340428 RepID=A0A6A6UX50_9PLEO|nr:acyltransferase ChoActase/COT/CPT [Sporormia fimetaria CBS 119925]
MFSAAARARAPTALLRSSRTLPQQNSRVLQAMAPAAKRQQSTLPAGYKEDMSKGKMLRFEDSLPRLPVPTLEETAKRYLKSVHPLLSKDEFDATTKAVKEFVAPGGPGETLQKRLIERRERPEIRNWISEWWNDAAYLAYRDPVIPYVSYFYSHRDDRKRRNPAKRAAAISTAVLEFKKLVDSASLEPEYMKKLPMAMSSYKWMFNCCRVPQKPADTSVKFTPEEGAHIIAIRKNQFWKIPTHIDGKQLTTAELEEQFKRVYEHAVPSTPIGVLTSQNRDIWTDVYGQLKSASPVNAASLKAIESAAFVVCLDDASPVTLEERAHQYWHGDGSNRWFDKPLQFIINDNGTSGFMGEHSMMDGTPTHRLNDEVCKMIATNALPFDDPSVRSNLPNPTPLRFETNPDINLALQAAQAHFAHQIGSHELRVQAYQGYGKGLIKKFKCSPDAYVQMVIQLAYHKFYGKNRPTYESAATRRFQEGRTETCRTVSDESVAFCNAMADHDTPPEKARDLLRAALDAHVKYISDASDGRGVDRHLFGLKKCLKDGEDVPALYKDPAFSYSSTWFISSSQLSSEYFNGYGWSQVVDDGWGIAYMINENSLQFNVVSKGLGSVSSFSNNGVG